MGPANEVPPSMPPSDFIVQHLDFIPSSQQQTATEHQPGDRGTHVILEESKAVEDKVSIVYIYIYTKGINTRTGNIQKQKCVKIGLAQPGIDPNSGNSSIPKYCCVPARFFCLG